MGQNNSQLCDVLFSGINSRYPEMRYEKNLSNCSAEKILKEFEEHQKKVAGFEREQIIEKLKLKFPRIEQNNCSFEDYIQRIFDVEDHEKKLYFNKLSYISVFGEKDYLPLGDYTKLWHEKINSVDGEKRNDYLKIYSSNDLSEICEISEKIKQENKTEPEPEPEPKDISLDLKNYGLTNDHTKFFGCRSCGYLSRW